jgi:hypothetical protein
MKGRQKNMSQTKLQAEKGAMIKQKKMAQRTTE